MAIWRRARPRPWPRGPQTLRVRSSDRGAPTCRGGEGAEKATVSRCWLATYLRRLPANPCVPGWCQTPTRNYTCPACV